MHTSDKKTTDTDLSSILEGLIKADVKFILVGGLAAVVQGAPVTTMVVEIVHTRSSENISKLFAFFKTRLGPLDVLAFMEEGKTYEDLLNYTIEIEFRGYTIHVLGLKMLIELKKTSKDPKEKQRLPVLEETLQQLEEESDTETDI